MQQLTFEDEWEQFFKTRIWDDVLNLAQCYPDKTGLDVDYTLIQNYNSELAEDIEDRPDDTLKNANTVLRKLNVPIADLVLDAAVIRISNFPYFTKVREIRIEHLNQLIAVKGIILKETEISSRVITSAHECSKCGEINYIDQRSGSFVEPTACANEAPPSQVNVPPATLSRFDLIFMMRDEPDSEKDRMIVELQGHLWQTSSLVDAGEKKWNDFEKTVPEIPPHLMQKYLQLSKQKKVKISNECKDRLQEFFLSIRNKYGCVGVEVVPVTMRQLEALFRLAKAEARLRHSNVAELRDAERAIRLVSESLRQAGMDPETGELDSDIINTGVGKSQRDRINMIKNAIKTLQGSNGGTVPLEFIMQTLEAEGIKRDQAEDVIQKLKTSGEVIEQSADRYRVM